MGFLLLENFLAALGPQLVLIEHVVVWSNPLNRCVKVGVFALVSFNSLTLFDFIYFVDVLKESWKIIIIKALSMV